MNITKNSKSISCVTCILYELDNGILYKKNMNMRNYMSLLPGGPVPPDTGRTCRGCCFGGRGGTPGSQSSADIAQPESTRALEND